MEKFGLYDPSYERDACGVGFVASLKNVSTHKTVEDALLVLKNLNHRGAVGAEENTGDGAGIMTNIPDEFVRKVIAPDVKLPALGEYAIGVAMLENNTNALHEQVKQFDELAKSEGFTVHKWRDVPINANGLGDTALNSMPAFKEVVLTAQNESGSYIKGIDLERKLFRLRKLTEHQLGVYFSSLSSRTIVMKGMLTTYQLIQFFKDLNNPAYKAKIALVHSRFSTNTFPKWSLAHPFRMIAHNGEINTIRGNRNWFNAKQSKFETDLFGDFECLKPILTPDVSDSASFDEALELLHLAGRSIEHSLMMMIPPAYENDDSLDDDIRAFHEYNSSLIEPWDGPASISFSDGDIVGACLDRNGLRPGRFWQTKDTVVLASETGVLPFDNAEIVKKGRLEPGKLLVVDTVKGRIVGDTEIKKQLAAKHPYREWLTGKTVEFGEIQAHEQENIDNDRWQRLLRTFGYTYEDVNLLIKPMAETGTEPIGSMGIDTPLAVLSDKPRLLFDYFKQHFAEVTNPPIDYLRERIVTSITSKIGPEPNLLADLPEHAMKLNVPFPVLTNDEMSKIYHLDFKDFRVMTINGVYDVTMGENALENRLNTIFTEVDEGIKAGKNFLILTDKHSAENLVPIPSLLLTSAVHQHLLGHGTRTQISMCVEAGDAREVHHISLLIGYGAAAVNPYMAIDIAQTAVQEGIIKFTDDNAQKPLVDRQKLAEQNLIKAFGTGVLKIMSKMGISTIMSYRGAQIFEAVGISDAVIDKYFTGTTSKIGGIGLQELAVETYARHKMAYEYYNAQLTDAVVVNQQKTISTLPAGGEYKYRDNADPHINSPKSIFYLQTAVQRNDYSLYKRYAEITNEQQDGLLTIRGLLDVKNTNEQGESARSAIKPDDVEPVSEIVKRFGTGAMSFGSISNEAHETMAKAMNLLGARSNSGEGGEASERMASGELNSRVKQVASARFGVTSEYLVNATDLQIKIAQGAKPGEGGHLPGEKVYPWVAKVRNSTPGVALISPPPHHDIYSIEDLAELILDLKTANPSARIHVKLASLAGVGVIAAGVSKAHADVILISGFDGGTGAAPKSSIKHTGTPWEIGLAETQQTLVANDLRDRVILQCDGQIKTGRDVVIAALLGAEEFGFATSALIAQGCILMRVCNQNTCPAGIATQDPVLRAEYKGTVESVVNFFTFIAEEVREILAELGFKTLEEAVGHTECLQMRDDLFANDSPIGDLSKLKASTLDLTALLHKPATVHEHSARHHAKQQKHSIDKSIDYELIKMSVEALKYGENVQFKLDINNTNRAVGAMLGSGVTKRKLKGEKVGDIDIDFVGSAGQSFGAFLPTGVTLRLTGDTNDYSAKGLSGGKIVVKMPTDLAIPADENVIAGNVTGFGATGGKGFFNGLVGERFAVRNSGATFVSEGTGDHALEYMAGGKVLILGKTGKNLCAGFLGGDAYILDLDIKKLNPDELKVGNFHMLTLDSAEITDWERQEILSLIKEYVSETDSKVAKALLIDWQNALTRITKITPKQYAYMSRELGKLQAEGIDIEKEFAVNPTKWNELLGGLHG
ncbi:MAG: glutamate synthase large subunit [Bifidobacteriaceae bacterium]|jgi:glutamate synthase (NADPH/NADH) large chain|nr:glutamate synthase large subunit [Bifidobacteriaceae bacterium]